VRVIGLTLLLVAAARAGDATQVDWVGDWKEAFKQAKETGKPVMVCINSKDGEQANERAAQETYRDPWFVPMSRRFVMIVVSVREHAAEGACPRFGKVTCQEHLACWKELRVEHGDEFLLPDTTDEMISPQHAWFQPDGKLLQRKEYELFRDQLLQRMRAVLAAGGASTNAGAPLDEHDRAKLERARRGDKEARWLALGHLFASEKTAVHSALANLLKGTTDTVPRCELLRAFGRAKALDMRPAVEKLLKNKDAEVRSFAAVCLEEMASADAVAALVKRAKTEDDTTVRKNLYRALGACGGPAANKTAAKALLRAVADDKQKMVCKHAALALRHYEGAGALVRKKLEQLLMRVKDQDVRHAIAYALAYVGDGKTSVRVLEKLLEKTHEDWKQKFVQSAIAKLQGAKAPVYASWLFWDDRDDPARKD
jgi:HEAT repeat protein